MSDATPEAVAANEMSKPGTFSLIERLQGRNMPKDSINIYLDEGAAYERRRILEDLDGEKRQGKAALPEEIARLEATLAQIETSIRESVAVVHMKGISSERYDQIVDEAEATYPTEYEEWQNPLSGQKTKKAIENPKRDELFNAIFISESIEKVVMGAEEDVNISPEWWMRFKGLAPLDGLRLVVEAAYKMRMTVQWMDEIQNEDFSPRS
jgi:hypothetical protein